MLLGKNALDFAPESASLVSHSSTPSSHAVSLARPSGGDDIDSESRSGNSGNAFDGFFIREVPPSNAVAFCILLCGPRGGDTATPQRFVKATNTCE
jgi:hypothetical protein